MSSKLASRNLEWINCTNDSFYSYELVYSTHFLSLYESVNDDTLFAKHLNNRGKLASIYIIHMYVWTWEHRNKHKATSRMKLWCLEWWQSRHFNFPCDGCYDWLKHRDRERARWHCTIFHAMVLSCRNLVSCDVTFSNWTAAQLSLSPKNLTSTEQC